MRLPDLDPHARTGAIVECLGRGRRGDVRSRSPAAESEVKEILMSFFLRLVFFLAALNTVAAAATLNRNAFTFTKYDLEFRVNPEEQAVAARGKVTLRNDTDQPQKLVVLQISSSLEWRMIQAGGEDVEYISQPFTSDIDHTGKLTEAVVTLPAPIPPKQAVILEVGYSGTIPKEATRLTRIGVPDARAVASDWDRVSEKFTAVRGI